MNYTDEYGDYQGEYDYYNYSATTNVSGDELGGLFSDLFGGDFFYETRTLNQSYENDTFTAEYNSTESVTSFSTMNYTFQVKYNITQNVTKNSSYELNEYYMFVESVNGTSTAQ